MKYTEFNRDHYTNPCKFITFQTFFKLKIKLTNFKSNRNRCILNGQKNHNQSVPRNKVLENFL